MEGPTYLFLLRNNTTGNFYQVVDGVVTQGAARALEYSPSGWQTISLSNERNSTYFALDRSFALNMEFVEDGAQILKYIVYTRGTEDSISLIVARQELYFDAVEYGFYYKPFYTGDVDLSSFVHDGPKVTVNIMEGGILRYIKANQNTKYEFPVDVPEAMNIKMDGLELYMTANYSVVDGQEIKFGPRGEGLLHALPLLNTSTDGKAFGVSFSNQEDAPPTDDQFFTKNVTVADAPKDIDIRFKGLLHLKCNVGTGGRFILAFIDPEKQRQEGDSFNLVYKIFDGTVNSGGLYDIPFDITVPLLFGRTMQLQVIQGAFGHDPNTSLQFLEGSNFSASFSNKYKTTYIKALPPLYVFQQLISKIGGNSYAVASSLFTEMFNLPITSGDAIRSIPGAVLKTSLTDFFKSYNVTLSVGMGMIAGTLRMERKSFFVDYNDPIDLGEVSSIKPKIATDTYYNAINVGFPEQNYDASLGATNGKLEFNNTSSYTTPITTVSKTLDLVSIFRADCFGIEFSRINLEGKTTTDDSSDNDVFFVHTKKVPINQPGIGLVYELDRTANQYITGGAIDPTGIFNVWLRPSECLKRNGAAIRSGFYKLDNQKLIFQTADKNDALAITMPGKAKVTESDNIEISTLDTPLSVPIPFDIDVPIDINSFDILDQNPVKAFRFTVDGVEYKGLPVKTSVEPYTASKQTFTLLSAPTNDLTQLINYYG